MITRTPFRESMCSQYKRQETECIPSPSSSTSCGELRLLVCTKYVYHQATSARKCGGSRGHAPSLPEPLKPCYHNILSKSGKTLVTMIKIKGGLWTIILHMLTSAPLNPNIFLRLRQCLMMQATINRALHIKHLSATWFSIPYLST